MWPSGMARLCVICSSITFLTAVFRCQQLYQYGYTVSIPLFEGEWRPTSFYDRIKYNSEGGMHTLCLLDIKVFSFSLSCTSLFDF